MGGSPAHVVLDGALILAIPIALLAGLVSFASPCVLPLVPGYLGYVTGMTGAELGEHGARRRSRMLVGVVLFVLGFTVVFVALGVTFGAVGLALRPWQDAITRVLGVIVVLLGLGFLGFLPFLERERRIQVRPRAGLLGAPLLGVVFGLGWAPCIGPTLAAVLSLSLNGGDPVRGAVLAVAYCLGLGIPFLLLALAFQRSSRVLGVLRRHRLVIMRLGGALLILVGLALVSGLWATWVHSLQGLISGFEPVL
jgi:cytochrome c-type biogenesis protein